MENEFDSQVVLPIADRVLSKHKIFSWSFDKGFWHKDNKELLETEVEKAIMPKKGKRNKQELKKQEKNKEQSFKGTSNNYFASRFSGFYYEILLISNGFSSGCCPKPVKLIRNLLQFR